MHGHAMLRRNVMHDCMNVTGYLSFIFFLTLFIKQVNRKNTAIHRMKIQKIEKTLEGGLFLQTFRKCNYIETRHNYSYFALKNNSEYISNTPFVTIGALPLVHVNIFESI